MKKYIVLSFLLCMIISACGHKINCKKTADQELHIVKTEGISWNHLPEKDYRILKECGNLDSLELELLQGPTIQFISRELEKQNKKTTYANVLQYLENYRQQPEYKTTMSLVMLARKFRDTPVNPSRWEQDKAFFTQMGLSETELEQFHGFLQAQPGRHLTYQEALLEFIQTGRKPAREKSRMYEPMKDLEAVWDTAIAAQKQVLVYFTAWSDITSRKLEEREPILTAYGNFLNFIAYTDDKTPLPEEEQFVSDITEKKVKNAGDRNLHLMLKYCPGHQVPVVAIFHTDGTLVRVYDIYSREYDSFSNFLEGNRMNSGK